ncbi:hypothetical protein TNCV_1877961 [Trichonephila clavipes]|nr:hypothetical protein TNCV_1877961 [Trichonephila clavipes]
MQRPLGGPDLQAPLPCVRHWWLVMLTAVSWATGGSNPGEGMDICECRVPFRQGATLNSLRAASPLVSLVEGEGRWEATDLP